MKKENQLDAQIKTKLDKYLSEHTEWASFLDFCLQIEEDERDRVVEVMYQESAEIAPAIAEMIINDHLKEQFDELRVNLKGEIEEESEIDEPKELEYEVTGRFSETQASKNYNTTQILTSNTVMNRIAREREFDKDNKAIMEDIVSDFDNVKADYMQEYIENQKELEKQQGMKKLLPNYKRLQRSTELLLEALKKAVKENKGIHATKWGIVVKVPQEERIAFEFAAVKLAALNKVKIRNASNREYSYEGYKFYIVEDNHLSQKVMLTFMKLNLLKHTTQLFHSIVNKNQTF